VKNRLISFFLFALTVILVGAGLPGRLEKAYEALSVYNYFKAKDLFYKSLKKDSVAAAYGLSVIYSRDDNPFTQLDSAHKFINISERNWADLEEQSRMEYLKVGVDSTSIADRIYIIDSLAYSRALAADDLNVWNDFIERFDNPIFRAMAIEKRNQIVFNRAVTENTSEAFGDFLERYPNADQVEKAKKLYNLRIFEERTADNSLKSYQAFIDSFPFSPYVPDAEERIYSMATASGEPKDYLSFIESFPSNPFREIAWRRIYALEVKKVNAESIAEFSLSYPSYPFMDELKRQFELAITRFYPVTDGDYWGFIDDNGELAIDFRFEWVENFSDGIAMVGVEDEVAYIDKTGEELSDERFSDGFAFNKGFAVVEKDDYYGVINRLGEYIVEPIYDDIGENSEGLFYAEKDGLYGYLNENGEIVIPFIFSDALDFHQGLAVVSDSSGLKGLINKEGGPITSFQYDWIDSFSSIELPVRFRKEGRFGLMNRGGLILTDTLYQAIGEFNEGIALVASNGYYGFFNSKADTVIDFTYTYSPDALTDSKFVNGHAKVYQKEKVGIIDSLGTKVFPAIFEDVGIYEGQLVPVKKRGKWGYSDLEVDLAIPYRYDYASNFRSAFAIAAKTDLFGVIDTLGEPRISFSFTSVEWMDTLLLVQDTAYGIITLTQDTLVPLEYQEIIRLDDKVVRLKRSSGGLDYYDLPKRQFLRREETLTE